MISISVNVTDGVSPMLAEYISCMTGTAAAEINEVAGRYAVNAATKYHREFDRAGGWLGKNYLGPGPDGGGRFGASVAAGWSLLSFDPKGATIANDADYYAFKVSGGTITPKRVSFLTIPRVPEAKGLMAADYVRETGHKLFVIKGMNALFERIEAATSGVRGKRGTAGAAPIKTNKIRAVYALVSSVTMPPWQGALPPEDDLAAAFSLGWRETMARKIEAS